MAYTRSWSWHKCRRCDENGEISTPRVGIEPTYLAFLASVLTITLSSLPDVTTLRTPTCLCGSFAREFSADYLLHVYVYTHRIFGMFSVGCTGSWIRLVRRNATSGASSTDLQAASYKKVAQWMKGNADR